MSRYVGTVDAKAIFEAADHWRQGALLKEESVFGVNSLWRQEYFRELDQYFVHQLDEGTGNFFDKLSSQIAPTGPRVKQLAAELLWILLLCPSNVTAATKREGIKTVWGWSEEPFPHDTPWLTDAVLAGIGSAGTAYNTNRWRELIFIIRVLLALRQLPKPEQETLLHDGWKMAEWLEQIPECNTRQFRHMLLFLLFPDSFERIFSGMDRRRIVADFSGRSMARVNGMTALELDRELAGIRQQQEEIYGTTELDFYEPPLRDLWGESRNVSWLLTWNPGSWPWQDLARNREATHAGRTVTLRWPCGSRSVAVGDRAYLARTGIPPTGIIATGNIVSAPYEAASADEAGEARWYVDVEFTRIQDPLHNDPYLSTDDLKKITIDQQDWAPHSSGIEISRRSAGILEKLWEEVIKPDTLRNGRITEPTNLILYGPPGTGKTYQLGRLIRQYSGRKENIRREAWLIQKLLEVRWFDAIFAALYDLGRKAKVRDIVEHEFIRLKARAMGRDRNVAQTVWGTLQLHAREESATVQYKNRSAPNVFDKDSNSFWFLAGEWEEECADQVELARSLRKGPQKESAQKRYEFVTFHQAYSYEDFVEGIRPVQDEDSGELSYAVVAGVFRRIAQKAKADPGQRYAIFIDEINRGNIAKIFGELITLIETDKRAEYSEDGKKVAGMEVTLPYSGTLFGVPKNLDLYGTMNTADRSIALLDTALRRRFRFRELMPDAGLISGSRGDGYIEDGEGGVINLRALLNAMNRRIRFLLNRDMTLGHAYFINVRDFPGLRDVLLDQVVPLLQEYFYDDWHRIQLVLRDVGPAGEKLEPQIICHETVSEVDILGFDHDDYEDLVEYRVAPRDDITPESIRKIYELPG